MMMCLSILLIVVDRLVDVPLVGALKVASVVTTLVLIVYQAVKLIMSS